MTEQARPDIAVIGGSGFYTFLDGPREVEVETPYGKPSAPIAIGKVGDRTVAFLPRHGKNHQFPAHQVNYRANMWALRSLGVRQVLAPCAVGGLQVEHGPGTFVVPDQLVDRTTHAHPDVLRRGRVSRVVRRSLLHPASWTPARGPGGHDPVDGGTLVVIEGPRFSTRAESRWYAAQGWAVIGMTSHPEAILAREMTLCYSTVCLVTDHDAGVDEASAVSVDAVFEVFAAHTDTLKSVLSDVIGGLGTERDCSCSHAVDGMPLPIALP